MIGLLLHLLLGIAIPAGVPQRPSASPRFAIAGRCSRDSSASRHFLKLMQTTATGTTYPYPELRDSLHIPAVPASEVVLLTDTATCGRAAQVYDSTIVARGGQAVPDRAVIVVRVGDRYAVQDPRERAGEWGVTVLFDSAFGYLSMW